MIEEMVKIKNITDIIVLTNDKSYSKNFFIKYPQFSNIIVHYTNERDYIDLWIISLTKNNILSRSTLAWWGAYLNVHPDKYILIHHNYQGFTINPYATYL